MVGKRLAPAIIGIPSCRAARTALSIKKAPAEVVCKTISEIEYVVFHCHDFTVRGAAIGWAPKAAAHHLHVQNWTKNGP
jgi:hypothetical protein